MTITEARDLAIEHAIYAMAEATKEFDPDQDDSIELCRHLARSTFPAVAAWFMLAAVDACPDLTFDQIRRISDAYDVHAQLDVTPGAKDGDNQDEEA